MPRWYRDPAGVLTIGYGHTGALPPGFREPLSRTEARRLLALDVSRFAAAVRKVRPPIQRQARFDALCSLAFNVGATCLLPSHAMGRELVKPNRGNASETFLLYDHIGNKVSPGLLTRRKAERKLWDRGSYT